MIKPHHAAAHYLRWLYYYPAEPNMGVCTSLGATDVVICSDSVTDLISLDAAQDAGNETALDNILREAIRAERAVVTDQPLASLVQETFNPLQSCSAKPPR